MPNYCANHLTLKSTDPHKLKDAIGLILDDNVIDFNIAVPMPVQLENVVVVENGVPSTPVVNGVDTMTLPLAKCHFARRSLTDDELSIISHLDTSKTLRELYLTNKESNQEVAKILYNIIVLTQQSRCKAIFGFEGWYSWRIANWGCKWNASDTEILESNDKSITVRFDTPWCQPVGWINRLIHMLPKEVTVELTYSEPGVMFGGEYTAEYIDGDMSICHREYDMDELHEEMFGCTEAEYRWEMVDDGEEQLAEDWDEPLEPEEWAHHMKNLHNK